MLQDVKVSQAEAGDVRRGLVTWGVTRQRVGETALHRAHAASYQLLPQRSSEHHSAAFPETRDITGPERKENIPQVEF